MQEWGRIWSDIDYDPFKWNNEPLFAEFDAFFAKKLAMDVGLDYIEARNLVRENKISRNLYEILTDMYKFGPQRAAHIAQYETLEEFGARVEQLECLVGHEAAEDVVTNGEFADYVNGGHDQYMILAREAAGKLGHSIGEDDVPRFYSIETLTSGEGERDKHIDITTFNTSQFRLLYVNDHNSVRYLDSLIEKGLVNVSGHEYWQDTKARQRGPRSTSIIKELRRELSHIFMSLGLPRPKCTSNDSSLQVDETTQKYLKEIRDKVYTRVKQGNGIPQ